jgi:hypothetical protein
MLRHQDVLTRAELQPQAVAGRVPQVTPLVSRVFIFGLDRNGLSDWEERRPNHCIAKRADLDAQL